MIPPPKRFTTLSLIVSVPLLACSIFPANAQEKDDDEWSIEESKAPSTTSLSFAAEEGTWISLDVSPDGEKIVFDLLGHVYEMPADRLRVDHARSRRG